MNKLREKLKNNIIALGSHISLNDSTVTEIMGDVGFDYLWIDTEHTPISFKTILLLLEQVVYPQSSEFRKYLKSKQNRFWKWGQTALFSRR